MALIFSPLTEDILEGPFQPYLRGVFIMLQDNKGTPEVDKEIDIVICEVLNKENFNCYKATNKKGTKDYLEKIVQIIRGCGFGVAIFSQYTNSSSLANIFFEIGLCNMLGKPVIMIINDGTKPPSDFVRTEWVTYVDNKDKLKDDFLESLNALEELGVYFDGLGDLALEAEEKDYELAFERYKQAVLLSGNKEIIEKIKILLENYDKTKKDQLGLEASRKRLRVAIAEFSKFISKT